MSRHNNYSKCLFDEKERIVSLFGDEITRAVFHEYSGCGHTMDMRQREYLETENDESYLEAARGLEVDFIEAENKDYEEYERELGGGNKRGQKR